jgi:hypothetical protein
MCSAHPAEQNLGRPLGLSTFSTAIVRLPEGAGRSPLAIGGVVGCIDGAVVAAGKGTVGVVGDVGEEGDAGATDVAAAAGACGSAGAVVGAEPQASAATAITEIAPPNKNFLSNHLGLM